VASVAQTRESFLDSRSLGERAPGHFYHRRSRSVIKYRKLVRLFYVVANVTLDSTRPRRVTIRAIASSTSASPEVRAAPRTVFDLMWNGEWNLVETVSIPRFPWNFDAVFLYQRNG
jgi:hypothetical protein